MAKIVHDMYQWDMGMELAVVQVKAAIIIKGHNTKIGETVKDNQSNKFIPVFIMLVFLMEHLNCNSQH